MKDVPFKRALGFSFFVMELADKCLYVEFFAFLGALRWFFCGRTRVSLVRFLSSMTPMVISTVNQSTDGIRFALDFYLHR